MTGRQQMRYLQQLAEREAEDAALAEVAAARAQAEAEVKTIKPQVSAGAGKKMTAKEMPQQATHATRTDGYGRAANGIGHLAPPTSVRDALGRLMLEDYAPIFEAFGHTDINHLLGLSRDGLREVCSDVEMMPGHARKFVDLLANASR